MSEKQPLSTWLRSREVYQDPAAGDPKSKSHAWRHELLSEYDFEATGHQKHEAAVTQSAPLQIHHLLMMLPVGLVLFALGWLFGSQAISMGQIASISPWIWTGCSIAMSLGYLIWRKQLFIGRQ